MGADSFCQLRGLASVAAPLFVGCLQQVKKDCRFPVDLTEFVIHVLDLQKRLHLPRNASHILSSQNIACVGAVLQIPLVQPAHDPPSVITYMLIPHLSGIGAVIYLAPGISRNPSGIRVCRHIFRAAHIFQIFKGDVLQVIGNLLTVCVDAAGIGAIVQCPLIDAANAPGKVIPRHTGGRMTPPDLTGSLIDSGNTAGFFRRCHTASHAAVYDTAVIDSRQNADSAFCALRMHPAQNRQVPDGAAFLYIAEQSHGRTGVRYLKPCDLMASAVKDAAEAGNHHSPVLPENNILLQFDIFIPGPGVHLAVRSQLHQFILRGYPQHRIRFFRQRGILSVLPGKELSVDRIFFRTGGKHICGSQNQNKHDGQSLFTWIDLFLHDFCASLF